MIDRTKAPAPVGSVSFNIPKIHLLKTANGIKIYYVKKEKLPIVQLIAFSSAGSRLDPGNKQGLSFLTSLMIDEGAGEYNSLQINNELEKLGTITSISSDHDSFSLSILSLKENFNRSFELLSKIINEPRLEENDFNREKKKVLDKILQLKDEPSFIASQVFDKQIFGSNFYGYPPIGYAETVQNISIDDVRNFYKSNLSNSEFNIIAVGNISESEIIELTEKYLPGDRKHVKLHEFHSPQREKTKYFFIDKKDSAQSEIRVGHLAKKREAEDYFSTRIMNTILGGQFSSRINLNLRERKGFTYGANSSFNYLQHAGYFEVATSVNIQNTGESITEILKELEGIRKNITDDEINFAKSFLIKQFPSRFETYIQTSRNILPLIVHKFPLDYYSSYTKNIETASPSEILDAAVNNIFTDEIIILAVGDKSQIEPQLRTFANSNLTELDIYGDKK